MKIYYVSHPYGGKQKNEAKADEIVRALQTELREQEKKHGNKKRTNR